MQRFLQAGYLVTCVELDESRARATKETVTAGLRRWVAKTEGSNGLDCTLERLQLAVGEPAAEDTELVVETVPENIDLKRIVLHEYSRRYPYAILATNTSALSIEDLAESVFDPSRFIGMHFFNPVPTSGLLEVVSSSSTDHRAQEVARQCARDLGLTPITVRDSPGFATSRLGIAIGMEAIRMAEEGVASPADIDIAMVLGYRFPVGPLELSDRVGLDVRLAIAEDLQTRLGERFRPPQLLREMVRNGCLGVKTGQGFYQWEFGNKVGVVERELYLSDEGLKAEQEKI